MIKLSPSILSADFANLARDIAKAEAAGADYIHVDVMDGHFVPNITIGAPVVKSLRKATSLPLDVHLMITDPDKYIEDFISAGADILTVHYEANGDTLEQVRRIRTEKNIAQKHALTLKVYTSPEHANAATDSVIAKLCNLEKIEYLETKDIDGASFIENNIQYSIPLTGLVDASEEIKKLEADLKYAEGFLQGVMKKLSNASFVNNAPQKVVDMERKKQADAEEKIRIIKEQLSKLK